MAFSVWQPGMFLTEERLNDAAMIGAVVFLANRATNQAITSGSDSAANAVSWDEVELDLLGGWAGGNPTRWTAPRDGWWMLSGAVGFNGSSGGTVRECAWYVNGSVISKGRARTYATSSISATPLTVEARTLPRLLAAGDYVELVAAQNSGGNLDTATGSFRPYAEITYAGPA